MRSKLSPKGRQMPVAALLNVLMLGSSAFADQVILQNPTATFSQPAGWNVSLIADGVTNSSAGWAVYDFARNGAFAESAVVETATDVGFASGSLLTFALYHVNHNPQHGLGRFRLSYTTDPRDTFADGENSGGDVSANWVVLNPKSVQSTDGVQLSIQPDGSVRASGANPTTCVYTVSAEVQAQGITGFRIEAMEDESLPSGGPGRYPSNGNFVLTEFTASIVPIERPPVPPIASIPISLKNTAASFSQISGWNASLVTDGVTNDSAGWAVYDFGRGGAFPETLVMETENNIGFATGSVLTFELYHVNHNPQSGLGRFRISYTTDSRESFADGLDTGGDVTATWTVLSPAMAYGTDGVTLSIQSDGSVLVAGENPSKTVYTISAEVDAQNITGFRLEALEDPTLPASGPGRSPNGNFVLTEFTASITPKTATQPTRFDLATDFSSTTNPNGVWSYGAKPSLSGSFSAFGIRGLNPFEYWQLVPSQEPTIYRNGTSDTITLGNGTFPPGATFLYSGTDGASNGFGVVRFTAPVTTNYLIASAVSPVYDGDPQGDTDYHVVRNGVKLYGKFLAPADRDGYTNVIALNVGDTLDFMVGRGADGSGTASGLKLEIRISGTSETVPTGPVAPPGGLVGWWPLDADGRDIVAGNDGVLLGSPVFGGGFVRGALEFDGVDDSVRVPADTALNVGVGDGFTIEGWIYPTDLSQLRPIAEWNGGGIGAHFWAGVDTAAPGDGVRSLFANIIDTDGVYHPIRSSKDLLVADEWQHVAISYDKASGLAAIYHNGIVVTQANLGTFTPSTTGDLYFGNRPAGPFSGILWKGKMDEMSLYNRALAASDIAGVFAAGSAGKIAPANPPPVNRAPVAQIVIEPRFNVWPDQTNVMVIAVDGLAMDVILDGSLSSDEDGDSLTYLWAKDDEGAPFASGAVVTNSLEVGFHTVTLVVDDGKLTGSDSVFVEVITLEDAVDELYGVLIESEIPRKDKRPLLATLDHVWNSIVDGRFNAAAKQLRAFQQKVNAQLTGDNAETGKRMWNVAQHIIDSIHDYLEHHDEPWRDDKGKGGKK